MAEVLSDKRRQILDFIAECQRERGYPPSVREIGEAVGPPVVGHGAHPSGGAAERGVLGA